MSKKQYIGFIILAIVIFGGVFYWYSLRPSIIKQSCYKEALKRAQEKGGREDKKFSADDYDTYYKWCLQKKGL